MADGACACKEKVGLCLVQSGNASETLLLTSRNQHMELMKLQCNAVHMMLRFCADLVHEAWPNT